MAPVPVRRINVTAPDSVEIAGTASGEGPGLLFVYGAMMEQPGWSRLAAHLQEGRTLYTYDRRGRGESGEPLPPDPLSLQGRGGVTAPSDRETSGPSSPPMRDEPSPPSLSGRGSGGGSAPHLPPIIQTEVDDLLAFAGVLPQPLDVFGHSSGALLVLHAAAQGLQARRLVLYEPVLPAVREPKVPQDLPARILAHVQAGDRDAAMEAFMRDGMWLSEADIERARGSERWRDQLRYVHTAAYDVTIARSYVLEPERLAKLRVPVLLLAGGASPGWMREGVQRFADALPDARVVVLEGQGHNAQFSAPEMLAGEMRAFLGADSASP